MPVATERLWPGADQEPGEPQSGRWGALDGMRGRGAQEQISYAPAKCKTGVGKGRGVRSVTYRAALAMTCHILASNTSRRLAIRHTKQLIWPLLFHCKREHGPEHSCSPCQADTEKVSKSDWKTKQEGTLVCLPPTMSGNQIFIWFLWTTHYSTNHAEGSFSKNN